MYKLVLIPLDGSRLAERILPFILQPAGPPPAPTVLLPASGGRLRDSREATYEN